MQNRFVPYGWTILTIALLCLPGSYVPGNGLFSIPQADKIAHIVLFGVNVVVWYVYSITINHSTADKYILLKITILTILLGIVMEFVQLYLIPRRSFDGADIVADIVGAVLGALAAVWVVRKLTVSK